MSRPDPTAPPTTTTAPTLAPGPARTRARAAAGELAATAAGRLGTRMPGRDRTWRGTHTVIMLTGIDAPGAQAVRDTLRQLASLASDHRIFRRPDRAQNRWYPVRPSDLDEFCERMVVPIEATEATSATGIAGTASGAGATSLAGPAERTGYSDDPDALLRRLHDARTPKLPLRFFTGPEFTAIGVEHPLADGRAIIPIFAEIVARAADGTPPLALVREHQNLTFPLLRALGDYYGRSPGRFLETLRTPRDTPPADPVGGPSRPWRPDPAAVSATSEAGLLPELRRWRSANTRGVGRTAVFFAAAAASLIEQGLAPASGGLHILADNRRYLPGRAQFDGNFSIGVYLEPPDRRDPASIDAALDTGLAAGRPLATMTLLALRSELRSGQPDKPRGRRRDGERGRDRRDDRSAPAGRIPVAASPALVGNYLGRLRELERVPPTSGQRADAGPPRFLTMSTPGHPEFVTFTLAELHGRLHATVGFHASTFDPDRIRAAVTNLAHDPIGLLERASSRQGRG